MTVALFVTLAALLTIIAASACLLLGRLDNRLGGDMLADPRTGLQQHLQRWLGIAHLHDHLKRQEQAMADFLTVLHGIADQTTELNATQQVSALNVHNALTKLNDNVADLKQQLADALANDGQITPEMQALIDQINTGLSTVKQNITTMDDGYEPVEPPADDNGDQPVVTPPADAGDTPVDNGGDVPVDSDDTGDVPPVVENRKR